MPRIQMYLEKKVDSILNELSSVGLGEDLSFKLIQIEQGALTVGLVIGPNACGECIVPEKIMEAVLLKRIQKDLPIIRRISIVRQHLKEEV